MIVVHFGYLRESRMTIEKKMQRRIQKISLALAGWIAKLAILGVLEKTIRMVPLGPVVN